MDQHVNIPRDSVAASYWANAIQRFIGAATLGFRVRQASGTVIEVPAGPGGAAAAIAVQGRWRYREATVQASVSGGAGLKRVFVTASDNNVVGVPLPNTDLTDFSFSITVLADGSTPATALFREVADLDWNGTAITRLRQTVDRIGTAQIEDDAITQPLIGPAAVGLVEMAPDALLPYPPIGTIVDYGGDTDPNGSWLICDGRAISRSTYATLFARFGTAFGAGDGSTTFGIPNAKGRVFVGLDAAQTEFNVKGETGGAKTHQLTSAEMPSHFHQFPDVGGFAELPHTQSGSGWTLWQNAGGKGFTTSVGGNGAHNNLQPYLVTNKIVRVL